VTSCDLQVISLYVEEADDTANKVSRRKRNGIILWSSGCIL